ncbi:succinylglutamate-semialdehyde dehydrogenase [Hyphobacterium sp. HN65]|uniref:Succinylglutamate-semialdehyde dehydrogenase n=1 Tax=Hyphobacterium lacteum TaxID=3116575 RepID=A0ABU7LTC3_9PROT|nr:succinylglutamate-semialdehyde dehydrogenase [Hyphobacterium sp. HN65]MEE2527171.1 succinylglutamate-semialdehyde dehydrogenase [Hyphobacterium sp. HN65]
MSLTGDCLIGGKWVAGSGEAFRSLDPSNGDTVWSGQAAGPDDVSRAFQAARSAFSSWARRPLAERIAIVERFGALLGERMAQIAELIARETGKPLWDCMGEAGAMAGKIAISIRAYHDRTGETRDDTDFGAAELRHKPLGVMFVLGPYNFPGHLPNGHIVPALIAGNTCVFKPSELTPAVGEWMVRVWQEAGLPDGVLNLVPGARETGAAALDNAELDGVLFTGSHNTGQFIHKKFAGRTGIQLALEMGGNNPLVIWDAADDEAAARIAAFSAFITSGQRCSCARRIIVAEGERGDRIVEQLVDMAGRLPVGAWNDEVEPFMGPLVSAQAAEQVIKAQAGLAAAGGKTLLESRLMERGAAFVTPGIVDVTGTDHPDAEVFGPLVKIIRVADFDAAISEANNTAYGLSSGLVSDDAGLWDRFRVESRAGIVNFNRPTPGAASSMPFGGPGHSGNLRPSAYYAADYCAYPVASQVASKPERIALKGLS